MSRTFLEVRTVLSSERSPLGPHLIAVAAREWAIRIAQKPRTDSSAAHTLLAPIEWKQG
jgi:hypothetical protein